MLFGERAFPSYYPITSKLYFRFNLLIMRVGTLLILAHWVKGQGQLGTLLLKPCGHDTDYSYCPLTSKLHILVFDDERRVPIDFGSWGQR